MKKKKNQINFFWISKRKGEISGQIRKVILIEREISDEKWINEEIEIFYIKKVQKRLLLNTQMSQSKKYFFL